MRCKCKNTAQTPRLRTACSLTVIKHFEGVMSPSVEEINDPGQQVLWPRGMVAAAYAQGWVATHNFMFTSV
jgi:hypothetical protein